MLNNNSPCNLKPTCFGHTRYTYSIWYFYNQHFQRAIHSWSIFRLDVRLQVINFEKSYNFSFFSLTHLFFIHDMILPWFFVTYFSIFVGPGAPDQMPLHLQASNQIPKLIDLNYSFFSTSCLFNLLFFKMDATIPSFYYP